jgi:hypothetical protein
MGVSIEYILQYVLPPLMFIIPLILHIYAAVTKRGSTFKIPGSNRFGQICAVISVSQISRVIPALSAVFHYDGPSSSDSNMFVWELLLDAVFVPPLMFILLATIFQVIVNLSKAKEFKYIGLFFRYITIILVLICGAVFSLYLITFILLSVYKFKVVIHEDPDERYKTAAAIAEVISSVTTVLFTFIFSVMSILLFFDERRTSRVLPSPIISLVLLTSSFLLFDLLIAVILFFAQVTFSRVMIICEPIALFAYLIIVFITIGPMNKPVNTEDIMNNIPVIEPKEDDALLLQREKDENERL